MQSENVLYFFWPELNTTASIAALVLAIAIFVFGVLSGARANKVRILFALILATAIGFFTMPLAIKAIRLLHIMDTKAGVVILVSLMMFFVSAVAANIYEIITVTMPDIGLTSKK
ncbi:MAG: hypothetical protein PHR77_18485 [Kiritimatiellae bacterium]|nr:hypothetical protein [Kiritimatiellia bacterium]MDD5523239.1 hypothetical protein [Kiritimatiellia bacterium]